MKSLVRFLAIVAACAAPPLTAQVVFTVTATAASSAQGYTSGNTYTFIFTSTTGSNFASSSNSTFDTGAHEYSEELTSDDQLWSTLSGTGLAGTFVRPTGNVNDPMSNVGSFGSSPQVFQLRAGTNRFSTLDIGMTTLSGGQLSRVQIDADGGTLPTFAYPGSYTTLESYYSSYSGTYGGFQAGTDIVRLYDTSNSLYLSFDLISLQISAVPEPSTYAAFAGLASIGLVVILRRRKSAA